MDTLYLNHPVFEQITKYESFYESLSFSVMGFIPLGTQGIINVDTYIYSSMQSTLESIKELLTNGHINDAFTLLRKFYDAAIINIYTNLFLADHFSIDNFVVQKIDGWLKGKEKLPRFGTMSAYIENSGKVKKITNLLKKDETYTKLRDRLNDHTHYNKYYYALLNDNQIYLKNRISYLERFSKDLENILILHLSYLFSINDHYMMSSGYLDNLDIGLQPEPDSQYFVSPFIQEIFNNVIKQNRPDLAIEIQNNTPMRLE
jgi:hypothetical protein